MSVIGQLPLQNIPLPEEKPKPVTTARRSHRGIPPVHHGANVFSAPVEAMQRHLLDEAKAAKKSIDLGHSGPKGDGVDGVWGGKTLQAVKANLGLQNPDLLSNPIYVRELQKQLLVDAQTHNRSIDLGHSGPNRDGADGTFGPKTAVALMALPPESRAALLAKVHLVVQPTAGAKTTQGAKMPPRLGRDPGHVVPGAPKKAQGAAELRRETTGKLVAANNIDPDNTVS